MAEVHLNGSVNLPTAEDVFRTVAADTNGQAPKIPDGETGDRTGWLSLVIPVFKQVSGLETEMLDRSYGPGKREVFRIRSGANADEINLPELGYAALARDSYEVFKRLRADGVIAPETRFQVCLPTMTAAVNPFVVADDQERFEPAYARCLRAEVQAIAAAIPHQDLAMQWDVAVEMGIVEGVFPSYFGDPLKGTAARLALQADWVPADVPVGFHLCYGSGTTADSNGQPRHWKEPADTANLVAVANAVIAVASRDIAWFSMPVPIGRDDGGYFEPLEELRVSDSTKLHLGLVHYQDGLEGAQRRADTAKRHLARFGVATECGMRHVPPELVPAVLQIHAAVSV